MAEIDLEVWESWSAALRSRYECISCLNSDEHHSVFLCRDVSSDKQVLIKATDDPHVALRLQNEHLLLARIHEFRDPRVERFPSVEEFYQDTNSSFCALVRNYIAGHSLESLVESRMDRPGLSREESIRYLLEVLDQLSLLHHLDPPVIHRDIKPQNIIVDADNHCHLIDLDIARTMDNQRSASDTVIIGTRLTAPPEQFGYQQTSVRSDLYSVGVLLLYCQTGSYDLSAARELDPALYRIVHRATSFDPRDRYASTEAMSRALRHATKPAAHAVCQTLLILLLIAILVFGGATLSRLSEPHSLSPVLITRESFHGDEDLYTHFSQGDYSECSVALTPEGIRVMRYVNYVDQLANRIQPTRTHLSADQLAAMMEGLIQSDYWPSLSNLLFVDLEIESLEPLRREYSSRFVCIEFHNCTVPSDLSPLEAIAPSLYELGGYDGSLFSCSTLDWMRGAEHLDVLSMSFVPGTQCDLSALDDLKNLRILRLVDIPVDEAALEMISSMNRLEILQLNGNDITDPSPLKKLTTLQILDLDDQLQ